MVHNHLDTAHTTVEQDDLTDREMAIINCLKIENQIKELANNVSDDGYNASEVNASTLDDINILGTRLKEKYQELGLEEAAEACQEAIEGLALTRTKLDVIQSGRPLEQMEHKDAVAAIWGSKSNVATLYSHTEMLAGEL